jgi:translation initiation factor IF-2
MSIRVHELAKEFKISTAALKKHLGDLGVIVKSHMSPVDDEIVKKLRARFNEEMSAVKQLQQDRRVIHKKIILADKKKDEAKKDRLAKIEKTKREEISVFVEKSIKKSEIRATKSSFKSGKRDAAGVIHKAPPTQPDVIPEKQFRDDKKTTGKKYEEKNKHLQAKLKSLKKGGRKKKFIPTEIEQAEITKNIRKTLSSSSKKKKYKKEEKDIEPGDIKIVISEFTSVICHRYHFKILYDGTNGYN